MGVVQAKRQAHRELIHRPLYRRCIEQAFRGSAPRMLGRDAELDLDIGIGTATTQRY
jgi:hypothetical protein